MSATSTNIAQINTNPPRLLLRPIYHILRPGNRLVPLIAGDELPNWLKVVGSYHGDMTNSVTVNSEPYPRKGEYDIICQYCIDATKHMQDQSKDEDTDQEEQGRDALRERGYAPTAQNQYIQRVPATSEAPVQQLKQPRPVRASQPQFLQSAQFPQPAQAMQTQRPGPSDLPPIRPARTVPPFLPTISSLSLPSMPSLSSQLSGLQQPQQQQIQYPQQHPYYLNWHQERGRTRDRDQVRYHPWDQKSPPRQPRRRLSQEELQPQLMSRSPIVIVRQGEQTRGLNATAPAFVPSSVASLAAPHPAGVPTSLVKN
ncbi:hypothetical protein TMatcc_010438 [Talaromyces marneffei ATCC 18224]|uniref:Uncharacterized protein n=1 Tax=Talaromyces marneffei (strain ATCC 18224 / CBS 334.59 / QM 7333) TaxID=441960 RepID=B6QVL3_TALMQ|nr:uncharacterized protein EYB26_009770 [Talaromyces marneffei]EEA19018.1 hypothetical protein PMAA_012870 [Talaromyces marneffei ATCC 18224]KAE8548713.1 hypothetical protein EYB25_009094 [Talaromyces marneffei]QGA22056.1 hypothetical protein EYB26_009770 [Talaromyces marneffei]